MHFKRILATAAVATVTLLTSGCMSMTSDITLDSEAKADGTVTVRLDRDAAANLGLTSLADFRDIVTDDSGEGNAPAELRTGMFSQTDSDYVVIATLRDATLDDAEDDFAKATVTPDGKIEFTAAESGDKTSEGLDLGTVKMTVNFPGEVTEFTGKGATRIDADTIRWEYPIGVANTIRAVSDIAPEPTFPTASLVTGAGGLSAALLAGAVVLRRRRPVEAAAE